MTTVRKAAGVIIQNKKVLVERSHGEHIFKSPGGKIEEGEDERQALVRELAEELSITVNEDDLELFGQFQAPGANNPDKLIIMDVFLVKEWVGEPVPGHEAEELAWVSSVLPEGMKMGSIFAHEVIPRLKEQDLID